MKATELKKQPCPCEECIVMVMCKYKNYSQLMECEIIRDCLYKSRDRMLLMINRTDDFYTVLQDLDELFNSDHSSDLISRDERGFKLTRGVE